MPRARGLGSARAPETVPPRRTHDTRIGESKDREQEIRETIVRRAPPPKLLPNIGNSNKKRRRPTAAQRRKPGEPGRMSHQEWSSSGVVKSGPPFTTPPLTAVLTAPGLAPQRHRGCAGGWPSDRKRREGCPPNCGESRPKNSETPMRTDGGARSHTESDTSRGRAWRNRRQRQGVERACAARNFGGFGPEVGARRPPPILEPRPHPRGAEAAHSELESAQLRQGSSRGAPWSQRSRPRCVHAWCPHLSVPGCKYPSRGGSVELPPSAARFIVIASHCEPGGRGLALQLRFLTHPLYRLRLFGAHRCRTLLRPHSPPRPLRVLRTPFSRHRIRRTGPGVVRLQASRWVKKGVLIFDENQKLGPSALKGGPAQQHWPNER